MRKNVSRTDGCVTVTLYFSINKSLNIPCGYSFSVKTFDGIDGQETELKKNGKDRTLGSITGFNSELESVSIYK